jgi:hypothetical protein
VLLTLLFLNEWISGHDGALFETSHDLKGEWIDDCEGDFIALTYGARPENQLRSKLRSSVAAARADCPHRCGARLEPILCGIAT